ncbi:phosphoglycolate phosphatase [Polymorphobacter arshaanensis]|uniref:Phosphoglycolate phosphatase n=1 Tax=Glacieibacterium arshaanense TaxID=2511025 RepID=A0A4Y9ETG7_9SPHN|nr:phosphoglycolate phosphatase [Polymorphobacter arshaanensis]TFU06208.1 phosphoglycolate phosphatase [Polymorphobacter arshaanensis]
MVHAYPRTLVFDLDGTLVDTSADLCASLNHVLRRYARPEVDPDTVRHLVGHGARALIQRGLALAGEDDPALVEEAVPYFLRYYADHIADGSQPYAGVEAALDELADAGVVTAVCTNKPEALARRLIGAMGWDRRFAAILGGDSLSVRKPDAAHVLGTIEAAGGAADSSVFVGDSSVDVAAARAARVPVVVVSFGFADIAPADLGADAVIDHYDALLPLLRRRPW